MRLILLASLRHAGRHPWQVLLATLGVALGVAVVTAIDLTRSSAAAAFEAAARAVGGRATHRIEAGPAGLPDASYVRLRLALPGLPLAPVLEGRVRDARSGAGLPLLGVDAIAEPAFRAAAAGAIPTGFGLDLATFMTDPTALVASTAAARSLGVAAGDAVLLDTPSGRRSLRIAAVVGEEALAGSSATELLIADLATAQSLLAAHGRLSRIELIAAADAVPRVESLLPPGAVLVAVESANAALRAMTDAFHTNLEALGLLALMVGLFLVYNAMSFMVVQRQGEIGTLRALGVSRRELSVALLGQAALLGVMGTAVGLLLGALLASGLLGLVSRTINDLYHRIAIAGLVADPLLVLKAVLLGIGGALLAALIPARAALDTAPRGVLDRATLERDSRRLAGRAAGGGLALVPTGLGLMLLPGDGLVAGFAGLFALVLGLTLMVPFAALGVIEGLQRIPAVAAVPVLRLGSRSVGAALSRTGVAIAALMLAVATTVGIGLMVGSFRQAVADWLDGTLAADWYVGSPSGRRPLTPDLARALAGLPGVRSTSHVLRVELPGLAGPTAVAAYGLNDTARAGFRFLGRAPGADFWADFEAGRQVMVTEPYAFRHGIEPGDTLTLPTPAGPQRFVVGAVYRDYASDRGNVALSRAAWDRLWPGTPHYTGIGLYTGPSFDPGPLRRLLAADEDALGPGPELQSGAAIRAASLAVFDRTFTITEVLRLLAGAIACVGVLGALLAIELERAREMAVLKALGYTGAQIRRLVLTETGLMGAIAGLLALPVGVAMAAALVFVINRRAFGWTMPLHLDPAQLLFCPLLAVLAALLAGIGPARRIARAQPARLLCSE